MYLMKYLFHHIRRKEIKMKFKVNDTVRIISPFAKTDSTKAAVDLLGQTAKITEVKIGQPVYSGTYPNYKYFEVDGYELSIGEPTWTWMDEELELVESENKNMNNKINNTEEEFSSDGFYLSYRVGDRINTMTLNSDADIWELGLAVKDFISGCGYSDNLVNLIMKEW
jgi:hypothetical protein